MLDVPSKLASNFNIGDRIECQEQFGTIKYIGEVEGYKGTWLGVDWDDPNRGKHDGSLKNKHYFTARTKTSGSFVRPEKIHVGQSLISAITSQYGEKSDESTKKLREQQLLSLQQSMNVKLEFVGFEKVANIQSNFNDLKVVNVGIKNVKYVGEPCELKSLCPNITELDISKNLINSWAFIFQICDELINLRWINVSENKLIIPDDFEDYKFPQIKTLVCSSMDLTWADVLKLTSIFVNVEELILPGNNITNLDVEMDQLQNLRLLDLESNKINSWSEVLKLGKLQKLEVLNLERTGIKEIRFHTESGKMNLFPCLNDLIIKNNLINEWTSINELDKLPNLESLKVRHNPICDTVLPEDCMQLIIAKIGKLKILNRTYVAEERRGAEIDYIKKFGLEWLSVKKDEVKKAEFLAQHGRFLELIKKYGEPEESELATETKTLKTSLIELHLKHKSRLIKKKLPPSITVQKLSMLVQKLFSLKKQPTLLYISAENNKVEIPLTDSCKELGTYSISNGDTVLVEL